LVFFAVVVHRSRRNDSEGSQTGEKRNSLDGVGVRRPEMKERGKGDKKMGGGIRGRGGAKMAKGGSESLLQHGGEGVGGGLSLAQAENKKKGRRKIHGK